MFITDDLDPDLDWSTLRLTEIAWGDQIISIPEDTADYYVRQTVEDHRDEVAKSWWVDVTAEMDYTSGQMRWTFRTLDPDTEGLPLDALAGFLPPNDETHRGEGHVAYTIRPRANAPEGTVLTNRASIVFDTNDPIVTNRVRNVIGQSKLYLPLIYHNHPPPAAYPLHISDAIPGRPVTRRGETYYVKEVRLPGTLSPGARYYFSSQRDRVVAGVVDDALVVLLDGTQVFSYDFSTSGSPTPAVVEVPRTTMGRLAGHTAIIEYRDVYSEIVRASPMWLVEITE